MYVCMHIDIGVVIGTHADEVATARVAQVNPELTRYIYIYLSIYLSISISIYLSIYLYIYIYMYIYLYVDVCMYVYI